MAKTRVLPASAMESVQPDADFQGTGWQQLPGTASQAAAAPDGSLWVLSTTPAGPDKYIWHYVNGVWSNTPGLAMQVAPAPDGTVYVINSSGGTYHWNGVGWDALGGGAQAISVGNDGSTYVISNAGSSQDRAIWNYNHGQWNYVGGTGTMLAANLDGSTYAVPGGSVGPYGLFVVNSAGGIYYTSGSGAYVQFPGAASAIAPSQGGLYVLAYPARASGNPIYYYDYAVKSWKAEPGDGVSISANLSSVYVVSANGGIYTTALQSAPGIAMTDPMLVQYAGDTRTLSVVNQQGTAITPSSWKSTNSSVATIDSSGKLTAVGTGYATITAALGSQTASASLTVTGAPNSINDVYLHFPLSYTNGPVTLHSDISTAFTQLNGQGATKVWNYQSRLFTKVPNHGHAVLYYTQDMNLYARVYNICGGNGTPPGTQNTSYIETCYDASTGIQSMIFVPTTMPDDTPRIQDELGHQFLYATYPASISYPWIYEGLGMDWNGGSFDASGNLVWAPYPGYNAIFKQAVQQHTAVSLSTLVNMDTNTFYNSLYSPTPGVTQTGIYFAQSIMFVYYLYEKQPSTMNGLFAQWNAGAITTNAQTLAYIQSSTDMTLDQLDSAYTAYAQSLP